MEINDDSSLEDEKNELDIIKISLNLNEEKYLLKIYPSKDNMFIIFHLQNEKVLTYYYLQS